MSDDARMSDMTSRRPDQPQMELLGVCPHDGHALIEVDGEVMHLIPGDQVHAWRRAQEYIADGHALRAVAEAEEILRRAASF